ncbi:trans-sialidase [Trypanosoma cruzi]|nr:trans-sialidase [Trypanosoma cruzi]
MLQTLWGCVNAEKACTHKTLAAATLARREDVSPRFVLSRCCCRYFGGVQPVSGVALRVPGTSADFFPSSCCACRCVFFAVHRLKRDSPAVRSDVRRRLRSGCAGGENSEMSGGRTWAVQRTVVLSCLPLVVCLLVFL